MQVDYSARAMMEMDDIAEFIQQSSRRSALRFLEAVESTADRLKTFPEFGARFETNVPELSDLRVCLVTGFEKYLLFYRYDGQKVSIERVVLGSRDLPNILKEGL